MNSSIVLKTKIFLRSCSPLCHHTLLALGSLFLCLLIYLSVWIVPIPLIRNLFVYHISLVGMGFFLFLILYIPQISYFLLRKKMKYLCLANLLIALALHPDWNPVTSIFVPLFFQPSGSYNAENFEQVSRRGGEKLSVTQLIDECGVPIYYGRFLDGSKRGIYSNGFSGIGVDMKDGNALVIGATFLWFD